jgi:hypothetical protein
LYDDILIVVSNFSKRGSTFIMVNDPYTSLRSYAKSSTLILVQTRGQLNLVKALPFEIVSACRIVALTTEVAASLEQLNCPHETLWAEFTVERMDQIYEQGQALLETGLEDVRSEFATHDLTCPEIDCYALEYFYYDCLTARLAVDICLEKFPDIECLLNLTGPTRPGVYYYESDVFGAVAAFCLTQKGLRSIDVNVELSGAETDISDHLPHRDLERASIPRNILGARNKGRLAISVHGLVDSVETVRWLTECGYDTVVLSPYPIDPPRLEKLSQIAEIVPIGRVDLDETQFELSESVKNVWIQFKSGQGNYVGRHPEIFANSRLDFHFQYYLAYRWPRLMKLFTDLESQLSALGADCLITSALPDAENFALVKICRRLGIPVISGLHSVFAFPKGIYQYADGALVWTDDQKRRVVDYNREIATVVTGRLANKVRPYNREAKEEMSYVFKRRLDFDPEKKLILLISTPVEFFRLLSIDLDRHLKSLKTAFNIPEDLRDGLQIVVKIRRRREHPWLYEKIIQNLRISEYVRLVDSVDIDHVTLAADVALGINFFSTGYFDAINNGTPCVHLQSTTIAKIKGRIGTDYLLGLDDDELLWPTLSKLIVDGDYRHQVSRRQYAHINEGREVRVVSAEFDTLYSELVARVT